MILLEFCYFQKATIKVHCDYDEQNHWFSWQQ